MSRKPPRPPADLDPQWGRRGTVDQCPYCKGIRGWLLCPYCGLTQEPMPPPEPAAEQATLLEDA